MKLYSSCRCMIMINSYEGASTPELSTNARDQGSSRTLLKPKPAEPSQVDPQMHSPTNQSSLSRCRVAATSVCLLAPTTPPAARLRHLVPVAPPRQEAPLIGACPALPCRAPVTLRMQLCTSLRSDQSSTSGRLFGGRLFFSQSPSRLPIPIYLVLLV